MISRYGLSTVDDELSTRYPPSVLRRRSLLHVLLMACIGAYFLLSVSTLLFQTQLHPPREPALTLESTLVTTMSPSQPRLLAHPSLLVPKPLSRPSNHWDRTARRHCGDINMLDVDFIILRAVISRRERVYKRLLSLDNLKHIFPPHHHPQSHCNSPSHPPHPLRSKNTFHSFQPTSSTPTPSKENEVLNLHHPPGRGHQRHRHAHCSRRRAC